ncbi:MAG: hypothetical protein L0220_25280, partial [Acidobacteria bacterium]|nr:hypothetical protein [Acidobacteriota bacterium]
MRPIPRLINRITIVVFAVIFLLSVLVAPRLIDRAGATNIIVSRMPAINAGVVSVNAASYTSPLSPGLIAAAFGTNLATRVDSAQSLPLPTDLSGTTIRLIDSRNVEHRASLFFVSPGQINFLIPDQVAIGNTQTIVTNGNGVVSSGDMQIVNSSPAIFTTTFDGRGIPVALTTYDGVFFEPVTNPDGTARLVSPGAMWKPNYLTLFATGARYATDMRVRIGNVDVTPLYSGPQGTFAGLDQINVPIPPQLPGGMTDIM